MPDARTRTPLPRALPVPAAARAARSAREIARVWAGDGAQWVTLDAQLWDDVGSWGIMLADLARHVANAHEQLGRLSRAEALARIRATFDAEWDHPTDQPTGGFEIGHS